MTIKSDPLLVLLDIKAKMKTEVNDELIKACYQLQSDHQYDKDRDTMKKMQALVETEILSSEDNVLL